MTISSRFAVAVHILTLLETGRGEPLTSEYVAGSVNTNPAVVRRILSMLARAGLTHARLGAGGGSVLARPAAEISLRDVYRAVECEERLFSLHHERPNPKVPRGTQHPGGARACDGRGKPLLDLNQLGSRTVADVMGEEFWRKSRIAAPAMV
jgi:DNA-binding IscR family transcriptional regulator